MSQGFWSFWLPFFWTYCLKTILSVLLYWNPKLTLSQDFVGSIREVFATLKSTVDTKLVLAELVWDSRPFFVDFSAAEERAHSTQLRYFVNTQLHKGRPFQENFQPKVLPSYIQELKASALISNQVLKIMVIDLFFSELMW